MRRSTRGEPALADRVLHLLSGREKGGIARVVADLSSRRCAGEAIIGQLGGQIDLPDTTARLVRFDRRGPFGLRAAVRLASFVRRESIAIVHTHNVTANLYGAMIKRLLPRVLLIVHVHGHFLEILAHTQRSLWKRGVLIRGNAWALRRCDRVIANSSSVRDFLVEQGVDAAHIDVVHNGVDVDRIQRRAREESEMAGRLRCASIGRVGTGEETVSLVGAFGRLAAVKNYPLFLEAARIVSARERLRIVIAGDGPERQRLEALAASHGIASRVEFVGWMENPYPLLAIMDVVVLTSTAEGFGLVLLEAMALERPVVATDVGGVREIVEHGNNGLLVPAADPEALAAAIIGLLRDPVRSRALGICGREVVESRFSLSAMRVAVEKVYLSAAAS